MPDPTPPTASASTLWRDPRLHVVFSVTLIAVLGVSSVAPALPRLRGALGVGPERVGLLITAFTVPGVFLTPLAGFLADRFGRRILLVPALVLFALAGSACALARDFDTLVWLRLLQGVGAAPIGALNLALLGDLYEGEARATAMGLNSSVLSVGTASYPAVGGALALAAWWAPFTLALLALPVGLAVLLVLRNDRPTGVPGVGRYLGGLVRQIRDLRVLTLFGVSLTTFVLLYGAILTWLPLVIADRFHGSPLAIGLIMATASLATAGTSAALGRLTRRFPTPALITAGFVLYTLALVTIPWVPWLWGLVLPGLVWGVGQGLNLPGTFTLFTDVVAPESRAGMLALNGTILRLGQTLGPLFAAGAYAVAGDDAVFLAGAGLAAAMGGVLVVVFRLGRDGDHARPAGG